MNKKILVILATGSLLVTSIAASGCSKKTPDQQTENTVKIQKVTVESDNISIGSAVTTPMQFKVPVLDFANSYFSDKTTVQVENKALRFDAAEEHPSLDQTIQFSAKKIK